MKLNITSAVVTYSFLIASVTFGAAQESQSSKNVITVGANNVLRCKLEKGLRITHAGELITAKLTSPIFIGTALAIPEGSTLKGHVASISTVPMSKRKGRLLGGDLTPPRIANVTFDQLVLPNQAFEIRTDITIGISGVRLAKYTPKGQRPGVRQMIKGQVKEALHEPNKFQRLRQHLITGLPYHPEYIDQGTVFDATLLEPIDVPIPVQPIEIVHDQVGASYIHLRLSTPMNSYHTAHGASIEATVVEPYYNPDRALLFPAGTKVSGTVNQTKSAGWLKKNGGLSFAFDSAQLPDGTIHSLKATVSGVQAPGDQELSIRQEGDIKATTSPVSRATALLSLMGPAMNSADETRMKTAYSRAAEGNKGFGLLGAGAAQASAATAIGFGYLGAARKVYDSFIAKGSNVNLPANTLIYLRMDETFRSTVTQVH